MLSGYKGINSPFILWLTIQQKSEEGGARGEDNNDKDGEKEEHLMPQYLPLLTYHWQ